MTKGRSYGSSAKSGWSSAGRSASSAGKSGSSSGGVSAARLQQKSGSNNAFGGYTKVNYGNGSFRMRPSGK